MIKKVSKFMLYSGGFMHGFYVILSFVILRKFTKYDGPFLFAFLPFWEKKWYIA